MLPAGLQKRKNTPAGKCLLWLLVLTLFWCSAGTVLWNGGRAICYHYARLQRQEASDTLILPRHAIVWIKKEEIRYRGRMFDVKKEVKLADGRVLFAGHYDEAESILFALLDNLIDNDSEQAEHGGNSSFWSFTAVLSPTVLLVKPLFTNATLTPCVYKTIVYSPYETSPPTPPPDVAA